jgi:hypothetical protein
MTAANLLSIDAPIKIAFIHWLGDKHPTKRKAREFLARFGAQYQLDGRAKPAQPVAKLPPQPCKLASTYTINRARRAK